MEPWMAELAALAIVLLSIAQGAYQGLLLKLYSLVKIILLLVGTAVLTMLLLELFPVSSSGGKAVTLIAVVIAVGIVLGAVERTLEIVDRIPVIKQLNKLGGAVLGLALGVLLLWVIMFLLEAFRDVAWCAEAALAVRQSTWLGWLYRINPLWALFRP